MNAICRLYLRSNPAIQKSISIDDSLYEKLKTLINKKYDATISDIINVALENYIDKNNPTFYEKPKLESTTYRTIMLRKDNLTGLQRMHKESGISVTRLLNSAIKEFLESL